MDWWDKSFYFNTTRLDIMVFFVYGIGIALAIFGLIELIF